MKTKNKQNLLQQRILIVATLIVIGIFVAALLFNILAKRDYSYRNVDPLEAIPVSFINTENFYTADNFLYYDDDNYESIVGIDVSDYQGDIDWQQVKNDGVDFAFIRVGGRGYGSGIIYEDENFKVNLKEAKKAGLDVGVYFYSMAINPEEAIDEAYFVRKMLRGTKLDLPVVFDYEDVNDEHRTQDLDRYERTDIAIAFMTKMQDFGYNTMVYANPNWLRNYYDVYRLLNFDIWLAHYNDEPSTNFKFDIWQYTSDGKVDGIDGRVDLNIMLVEK